MWARAQKPLSFIVSQGQAANIIERSCYKSAYLQTFQSQTPVKVAMLQTSNRILRLLVSGYLELFGCPQT